MKQTELESAIAFQRKGKKYKTKYFTALGELFKDMESNNGSQTEIPGIGRAGHICDISAQKRDKVQS